MIVPINRSERITLRSQYLCDDIFVILYEPLRDICKDKDTLCPELIWRESALFANEIRKIKRPEWELDDCIDMLNEKCGDDSLAILIMTATLYRLVPESTENLKIKNTLQALTKHLRHYDIYNMIRVMAYKSEIDEELQGHAIDIHTYLLKEEENLASNKNEALDNQKRILESWVKEAIRCSDDVLNAQIIVMTGVNRIFGFKFTEYVDRLRDEEERRVDANKQPSINEQYNILDGGSLIKDSSFPNAKITTILPQSVKKTSLIDNGKR